MFGKADEMAIRDSRASMVAAFLGLETHQTWEALQHIIT